MSLTAVVERLRSRAEDDPSFAETLEFLADAEVDDPFTTPPDGVRALARDLNARRQADRTAGLRERSLTTSEVVELVASINDRKGVDRRRHRGALLGIRGIGRQVMHPSWQFDRRRRDTHKGLADVIEVLLDVAGDEIEADAIATAAQPDGGGDSIADFLASGDVSVAVRLARLAGDQS